MHLLLRFFLCLTVGRQLNYVCPLHFRSVHTNMRKLNQILQGVKIYVYPAPTGLLSSFPDTGADYPKLEYKLLEAVRNMSGFPGYATITTTPEIADFFWVPHALLFNFPNNDYVLKKFLPFLQHIYHDLPYYNRSQGSNHIMVYNWDQGPLCDVGFFGAMYHKDPVFKQVVHPMIIIGYHGMQGVLAPNETHTPHRRECFRPGHDISVPQWNSFHLQQRVPLFSLDWLRAKGRCAVNLQYFGTFASGFFCSPHIRFYVGEYWLHHLQTEVRTTCGARRHTGSSDGLFGLAPAGFGCWSSRFYDYVHGGVIPVIMADPVEEPFERFFDYRTFTVKVLTGLRLKEIAELDRCSDLKYVSPEGRQRLLTYHFPTLDSLRDVALDFRAVCGQCYASPLTDRPASPLRNDSACLAHPLAQKYRALLRVQPWLSWDLLSPRNALKLVLLELFCRTDRGRGTPICSHDVRALKGSVAWEDYGV